MQIASSAVSFARKRWLVSCLLLGGLVGVLAAGTYVFWIHDYLAQIRGPSLTLSAILASHPRTCCPSKSTL